MKKYYNMILIMILSITLGISCTDKYYFETGTSNDQFNGSTWDYLNSKPEHFSKVVEIIKAAHMENVFQSGEITFFAPKNPSVQRAMNGLNVALRKVGKDTVVNYTEIKPEVWEEFLGLYVVDGRYELKDIPQVDTLTYAYKGQQYKSLNGRSMNIGSLYNSAGGVQYAGYRQLIYAYTLDFALPELTRINTVVTTANQKVTNGMVHVLQSYTHTFSFNTHLFFERVNTVGLVSP